MNDEFERIWKDGAMRNKLVLPRIFLDGPSTTTDEIKSG
jgi:hypothetical protein